MILRCPICGKDMESEDATDLQLKGQFWKCQRCKIRGYGYFLEDGDYIIQLRIPLR